MGTTAQPQVDPIVAQGTPGTTYCPITQHVLSNARPELGETFIGYLSRTYVQANGDKDGIAGAMVMAGNVGTPDNWPLAADKFFNLHLYAIANGYAQADPANNAWIVNMQQIAAQQPQVTPDAVPAAGDAPLTWEVVYARIGAGAAAPPTVVGPVTVPPPGSTITVPVPVANAPAGTISHDFGVLAAGSQTWGVSGSDADAYIASFVTPSRDNPVRNLPAIGVFANPQDSRQRAAYLSMTPDATGKIADLTQGLSVSTGFAVGNGDNAGYYPVIPYNTRVYLVQTYVGANPASPQRVGSIFSIHGWAGM